MVLVVKTYIHHYVYCIIVTHVQGHARQYNFHHLTYLRVARFALQLKTSMMSSLSYIATISYIILNANAKVSSLYKNLCKCYTLSSRSKKEYLRFHFT